jgi:predicted phosphoribosyltransferase
MFKDRAEAGRALAHVLKKYDAENPLVLGLPRGGVVVGAEIARARDWDFDVMLVKKLRAPDNPELALGAVGEDGHTYVNHEIKRMTGAEDDYLDAEVRERMAELSEQRERYRISKAKIPPTNRAVILVDDGLATGATMIAAVQTTALENPRQIVIAVPVGSPEAVAALEDMEEVSEVICLEMPPFFRGVAQAYADFTQVSDEEVVEILEEFA